jgi:uncharacterized RDD family membrane protein YckC
MSLAGAPVSDSIELASATGRALPRRLLALIIDTLVVSLLDAIINGTFGVTRVTSGIATTMASGGFTSFTTQTTVDWPWLALLWVTYYAVLEGLFSATVGKRFAGLRVTDLEGRLIDVLPFTYVLGGILTLVTKRHQRLGDLIARTIVVPVSAATSPPLPPGIRRRRAIGLAAVTFVLLGFCAWFAYYGRPPLLIESARNTGAGLFSQGVSHYQLGTPRRGSGTITYPIAYEIATTNQACQGQIILRWRWFFPGWAFGGGTSQCSPRTYP